MYGLPHQEELWRYEHGIMYYDEIMSFTYMFSDFQQLGTQNADKKFFVMDGYYSELGLFTIRSKIENCAKYVKSRGMTPVIHLTKSHRSFYSILTSNIFYRSAAIHDVKRAAAFGIA